MTLIEKIFIENNYFLIFLTRKPLHENVLFYCYINVYSHFSNFILPIILIKELL